MYGKPKVDLVRFVSCRHRKERVTRAERSRSAPPHGGRVHAMAEGVPVYDTLLHTLLEGFCLYPRT